METDLMEKLISKENELLLVTNQMRENHLFIDDCLEENKRIKAHNFELQNTINELTEQLKNERRIQDSVVKHQNKLIKNSTFLPNNNKVKKLENEIAEIIEQNNFLLDQLKEENEEKKNLKRELKNYKKMTIPKQKKMKKELEEKEKILDRIQTKFITQKEEFGVLKKQNHIFYEENRKLKISNHNLEKKLKKYDNLYFKTFGNKPITTPTTKRKKNKKSKKKKKTFNKKKMYLDDKEIEKKVMKKIKEREKSREINQSNLEKLLTPQKKKNNNEESNIKQEIIENKFKVVLESHEPLIESEEEDMKGNEDGFVVFKSHNF